MEPMLTKLDSELEPMREATADFRTQKEIRSVINKYHDFMSLSKEIRDYAEANDSEGDMSLEEIYLAVKANAPETNKDVPEEGTPEGTEEEEEGKEVNDNIFAHNKVEMPSSSSGKSIVTGKSLDDALFTSWEELAT
jgi:hypothetical protein